MASQSIDELRKEALEVFGRELSDEQLQSYRGRLPTMLENARLLERWAKRLEQASPTQIQRPIASGDGDRGRADD